MCILKYRIATRKGKGVFVTTRHSKACIVFTLCVCVSSRQSLALEGQRRTKRVLSTLADVFMSVCQIEFVNTITALVMQSPNFTAVVSNEVLKMDLV